MSRVRGSGNRATEIRAINLFRNHGITGWRRNSRLPGKPDLIFTRQRLALFVDGCFWHSCPVHAVMPASNREFWMRKLSGNQARDRAVAKLLRSKGWHVLRIWQHELTDKNASRTIRRVKRALRVMPRQPSMRAENSRSNRTYFIRSNALAEKFERLK